MSVFAAFFRSPWPALCYWLCSVYLLLLVPGGGAPRIPHFDKVGHLLLFACWAGLIALALWLRGRRDQALLRPTLLLCLAWAIGSELAQGVLTATRSADVLDVVADMVGATLGVVLLRRIATWRTAV